MSADNGVYIIKTFRTVLETNPNSYENNRENYVYRVAHTSAIDNGGYYLDHDPMNYGAWLYSVFKNSPVFISRYQAQEYAVKIHDSLNYVEYGVAFLPTPEKFIFFGDF